MKTERRGFLKSLLGLALLSAVGSKASEVVLHSDINTLIDEGAILEPGKWHHVSVVRDGGVIKNYMNGARVNEFNNFSVEFPVNSTEVIMHDSLNGNGSYVIQDSPKIRDMVLGTGDFTCEFWLNRSEKQLSQVQLIR